MDEMHYWELGLMLGNNSGGKVVCNMLELIDGLPTLYTLTAGEFTFEFKIPTDPIFHENVSGFSESSGVFYLITYPYVFFVCKKGSQIVCAKGARANTSGTYSFRKDYDSEGNLTYSRIFTEAKIITVRLYIDDYGKPQSIMVYSEMTYKYYNSEGSEGFFTSNIPWTHINIYGGENHQFFTSLSDDKFAFAYSEAIEALKNLAASDT